MIKTIGFHATGTLYAATGIALTLLIGWCWREDLWRADAPANGRT